MVVCVDPERSRGKSELDIDLDGGTLRFVAELGETVLQKSGSHETAAPAPLAIAQKASTYLEKHHLEVRLADAMAAVLRERPADPAAFLAKKLSKNAGLVAKLPAPCADAEALPPTAQRSPPEPSPPRSVDADDSNAPAAERAAKRQSE